MYQKVLFLQISNFCRETSQRTPETIPPIIPSLGCIRHPPIRHSKLFAHLNTSFLVEEIHVLESKCGAAGESNVQKPPRGWRRRPDCVQGAQSGT